MCGKIHREDIVVIEEDVKNAWKEKGVKGKKKGSEKGKGKGKGKGKRGAKEEEKGEEREIKEKEEEEEEELKEEEGDEEGARNFGCRHACPLHCHDPPPSISSEGYFIKPTKKQKSRERERVASLIPLSLEKVQCPPCGVFVLFACRHKVEASRCSDPVRLCRNICEAPLSCGNHSCSLACHNAFLIREGDAVRSSSPPSSSSSSPSSSSSSFSSPSSLLFDMSSPEGIALKKWEAKDSGKWDHIAVVVRKKKGEKKEEGEQMYSERAKFFDVFSLEFVLNSEEFSHVVNFLSPLIDPLTPSPFPQVDEESSLIQNENSSKKSSAPSASFLASFPSLSSSSSHRPSSSSLSSSSFPPPLFPIPLSTSLICFSSFACPPCSEKCSLPRPSYCKHSCLLG